MERIARLLLVVLALVLPFEVPLFRLGPLQITTVELVLYAFLAAWGTVVASAIVGGRASARPAVVALGAEPMARAVAVWFGVVLASAVVAPTDRGAAVKFALRTLSGILLFFAARTLARPLAVRRRVLFALLTGASLSAVAAVLEALGPPNASLWSVFHEEHFDALGLPRASGVFGYPTIGAMFWEAVVPLVVVASFSNTAPPHSAAKRGEVIAVLGGALLVAAILASATRSGLAGSAIGCVVLVASSSRWGKGLRRVAVGVLASILVSLALALTLTGSAGSLFAQRLQWWRDADWFRAEYRVDAWPRMVHVGDSFAVRINVRNTGAVRWEKAGPRRIQLSYHWAPLDAPATAADYEGLRTELPSDVAPRGTVDLIARVRAPNRTGTCRLRWDLVEEGVSWFSERGNAMAEERIDVAAPIEGESGPIATTWGAGAAPVFDPPPPSRMALWRAALALWRGHPLLGIGPDNFRRRYEAVLSPAPTGQAYSDTRIHANSLYFETLADLGLAGIVALASIAFALVRIVRAHWIAGRLDGFGFGLAAGLFFVHGVLDYFFEFTALLALFWLLLGLTTACGSREAPPGSPP